MMDYPLIIKAEAARRLIEIQSEIQELEDLVEENLYNPASRFRTKLEKYYKEIGPEYRNLVEITGTTDYRKLVKMKSVI